MASRKRPQIKFVEKPKKLPRLKKHSWKVCIICQLWFAGSSTKRTCSKNCAKEYARIHESIKCKMRIINDEINNN